MASIRFESIYFFINFFNFIAYEQKTFTYPRIGRMLLA